MTFVATDHEVKVMLFVHETVLAETSKVTRWYRLETTERDPTAIVILTRRSWAYAVVHNIPV